MRHDGATTSVGTRGICALAGVLGIWLMGCSITTEPQLDSKSNWLRSCESNAECGSELSCLCGACTVACDPAATCEATPDGAEVSCIAPTLLEKLDACAGLQPAGAPACLLPCDMRGRCAEGLTCQGGVCVAMRSEPSAAAIAGTTSMSTANALPPEGPTTENQTGDSVDPSPGPAGDHDALRGYDRAVPEAGLAAGISPAEVIDVAPLLLADPKFQLSDEFSAWLVSGPDGPRERDDLRVEGEAVPDLPHGLLDSQTGALTSTRDPDPYQFVCLVEAPIGGGEVVRLYFAHLSGERVQDPMGDIPGRIVGYDVCRNPYALGFVPSLYTDEDVPRTPPPASESRCILVSANQDEDGSSTINESWFSFSPDGILLGGSTQAAGERRLWTVRVPLDTCIGELDALEAWIAED